MNQPTPQPDAPAQPEILAPSQEMVTEPLKLIRIASMLQAMRNEVSEITLDQPGRSKLIEIHDRMLHELREIMSEELKHELDEVIQPLGDDTSSDAEIRIVQAQLAGWIEGLFHGIRASMWNQQVMAQQQALRNMEALQALEAERGESNEQRSSGMYL